MRGDKLMGILLLQVDWYSREDLSKFVTLTDVESINIKRGQDMKQNSCNIILKNPIESEIYKAARKKGMILMQEDATLKALAGIIPFAEVYNFNNENE